MVENQAKLTITAEDRTRTAILSAKQNLNSLEREIGQLKRGFGDLGNSINRPFTGVRTGVLAVGASITAATTALASFVGKGLKVADALAEIAEKTGVAVEDLSTLAYAGKQSGLVLEDFGRALPKLAQFLVKTGQSSGDLASDLKRLADAVQAAKDPAEKLALASKALGEDLGPKFVEFLNLGRQGVEEFQKTARAMGLEISTKTAKQAAEFNDKLTAMADVASRASIAIGSGLVGGLGDLKTKGLTPANLKALEDFGAALATAAKGAASLASFLGVVIERNVELFKLRQSGDQRLREIFEEQDKRGTPPPAFGSFETWRDEAYKGPTPPPGKLTPLDVKLDTGGGKGKGGGRTGRVVNMMLEQAKANLTLQRDWLEREQKIQEQQLEDSLISFKEYYNALQALRDEDIAQQIHVKRLELDAAQDAAERLGIETELSILERERADLAIETARKQKKAVIEDAQRQLEQLEAAFNAAMSRMAARTQEIDVQLSAGLISEFAARQQITEEHRKVVAEVGHLIPRMEELARATNNEQIIAGIESMKAQFLEVALVIDDVALSINKSMTEGFADAFTDVITGAQNASVAFREFAKSVVRDIANILSQRLAQRLFGSVGGAGGMATGGLGGLVSMAASVLHGGGVVGAAGPARRVPVGMFAAAPRFHDGGLAGLRPGEMPAILERGETVLPKDFFSNLGKFAHENRNVTVNAVVRPDTLNTSLKDWLHGYLASEIAKR